MSRSGLPDMDVVVPKLDYGLIGPDADGVRFFLRLDYRDETVEPPVMGRFEHQWAIPWIELDLAERSGSVDQLLIELRARQERTFIHRIARQLGRIQGRLEMSGGELVLRRVA